jgi:transposase
MGRKSWLFCWTELGAKQVGIIQSLIDVLQRVSQHPASRVAELTPRLWKTLFADNPLRSIAYGLTR